MAILTYILMYLLVFCKDVYNVDRIDSVYKPLLIIHRFRYPIVTPISLSSVVCSDLKCKLFLP